MRIAGCYSHLNGLEYLLVHKLALWTEIKDVIHGVDASLCKTKISRERRSRGDLLYSPIAMNEALGEGFYGHNWHRERTDYWVTEDPHLIRSTMDLPATAQKQAIERAGAPAYYSYNQTDFVKERVAVEVQFGKYAFVAYDLFVKHMAFYVANKIDVGVEILPVKALQVEMSSGVPYYEGGLYDLIREGRGMPAVPLVLVGVAP